MQTQSKPEDLETPTRAVGVSWHQWLKRLQLDAHSDSSSKVTPTQGQLSYKLRPGFSCFCFCSIRAGLSTPVAGPQKSSQEMSSLTHLEVSSLVS